MTALHSDLAGQTIIVAGASGIGAAIIHAFDRQGCSGCLLGLDDERGRAGEAEVLRGGQAAAFIGCDLTVRDDTAHVAVFVTSEEASAITNHLSVVDGGWT